MGQLGDDRLVRSTEDPVITNVGAHSSGRSGGKGPDRYSLISNANVVQVILAGGVISQAATPSRVAIDFMSRVRMGKADNRNLASVKRVTGRGLLMDSRSSTVTVSPRRRASMMSVTSGGVGGWGMTLNS